MKKIILILASLCMMLLMTSCKRKEPIIRTNLMLNTIVSITVYDNRDVSIVDGAFRLISEYENMFSKTIESSDIYKINHRNSQRVKVSPETAEIIAQALHYSDLSDGKFDITIDKVNELWDFTGDAKVPPQYEIKQALKSVNYKAVSVSGEEVLITDDSIRLDLGAIAKGYIADKVKEYLVKNGVENAIINLGGNILCVGTLPNGNPMNIGIRKPFYNDIAVSLSLTDKSVVSSGVYERYFEKDGKLYHHILDTKTGYPVDNNLYSVTVISDKSVDGDALSTALFTIGLDEGIKLADTIPDTYVIFITDDYKLYYSRGTENFITE